jgi:ATP-binding cassette subfamily B protein
MNIPLRRYWDLLGPYLMFQRGRFSLLVVLLLSSVGLQVINPQIVRYFIDTAMAGAVSQELLAAALVFVVIALFQQVLGVSATYLGENVAWSATNELRAELARHCLNLDMSFHSDTSPGELIERIDGDVQELSNFFSQMVVRVVGNLVLLVGILFALFLEDWRLGLVYSVFAVVTLFALNRVRGLAIPHQKALRAANAELFGYLEERLSGTEDIRSSGAVDFVIRGLYKLQYAILGHWRKAWRMFVVVRFTGGMMMTLGTAMAFLVGFYFNQVGAVTIGTVYLIVHYTNMFGRPIRELTQQAENVQNIGASIERLVDLRGHTSQISDGAGAFFPDGPLSLAFDNVSFGYFDDEWVLRDLSFSLAPRSVLGLLGRTGSGKTTLARLVFRLYDARLGNIELGEIDIHEARLQELRQRVAIVTQDVQLFQASVRDNLTFFDNSIPDAKIHAVIEELGLADWYQSLPEGLETVLESGGRGLSAGEAQLLAFTRVFLRDPGLVILDEASSRLDPATENLIERAVDKLLMNRTAIIIAHRLGTVHRANDIMILDQGRISEFGDRKRLAADSSSRFHSLLQTGLEEVLA